jgi:hypothetical protein
MTKALWGVALKQLAKWRASLKSLTSPQVAATIAVAVISPMPGTDSRVVHSVDRARLFCQIRQLCQGSCDGHDHTVDR